jgi:hypothetical protein
MAGCSPVTYNGVTASVFNSLKGELEKNGFTIPGPQGVISGPFSIKIEYAWDEATETLQTQVLDKSFFVSCNQIHDQLINALNKFTA